MADTRSVHETRFEAAVKVIQSLPKNGTCISTPARPRTPIEEAACKGLRAQFLNLISLNLSASTPA